MAESTKSLDLEKSSSQYAYIADNTSLSITGDITIEGMIKLESLPSTVASDFNIASKWNNSDNNLSYELKIDKDDNKLYIRFSNNGTFSSHVSGFSMNEAFDANDLGIWVHIAFTVDVSAPSAIAYKNGRAVGVTVDPTAGTSATSIFDGTADFTVGCLGNSGSRASFFDGKIKNLRVWNDIRTQKEIIQFMGTSAVGEDNLVSEWKFENDYTDSQGSNNLTASGSPTFADDVPNTLGMKDVANWTALEKVDVDVSGLSLSADLDLYPVNVTSLLSDSYGSLQNKKYSLDLEKSSSQYASVADGSQAGLDDPRTIEAWIKLEELPSVGGTRFVIFNKGNWGTNNQYGIYFRIENTNKLDVIYTDTVTGTNFTQVACTNALTSSHVGRWVHVATTIVPSTQTILFYVDGELQATTGVSSAASSIANNTGVASIGGRISSSSVDSPFDGKLKNVRVWSDVRTQSEILEFMNRTASGETGLVSEWELENDLTDSQGSNDLTANGSPVFATDVPQPLKSTDLRFTTDEDGLYEVPYELVSIDTSGGTIQAWVLLPTLTYDASFTALYVWGTNSGATGYASTDIMGGQSVWQPEYKGVWHLDETSGTRADSTANANDLTDNNTVTSGTGKIGTGAIFDDATSENLDKADNASLSTGNIDFITGGWVKLDDKTSNHMIVSKAIYTSPYTNYEFGLVYHQSTDRFRLAISNGTGTFNTLNADNFGSPSIDTWYFVVMWHIASSSQIGISVNGVVNTDTATINPMDSTAKFSIGSYDPASTAADDYMDGMIDNIFFKKDTYSADWIKTEYNLQNDPTTYITNTAIGGGGGGASSMFLTF